MATAKKQSRFVENLTADNKSIKAKRASLLETTYLTELDAEITDLKRQKIQEETRLSNLLDFAPTNTQSLTFGNVDNSADAKKVLLEYHNAKLRLKMEIEPSLEIYQELKDELFGDGE